MLLIDFLIVVICNQTTLCIACIHFTSLAIEYITCIACLFCSARTFLRNLGLNLCGILLLILLKFEGALDSTGFGLLESVKAEDFDTDVWYGWTLRVSSHLLYFTFQLFLKIPLQFLVLFETGAGYVH